MLMLNQIRTRPGAQKWEDPEYSPGGNAMEHFCNSRNKVHRFINSRITDNKKSSGKLIGIQGVVKNFKNKVGDGSLEGNAVGFRIMFGSGPIDERIKFYSLADYKLLNKKKDEEEGDDY
jgi:RecA/RadA recombinase